MNKEFWGAKRVFITGHTGFKGSWLSLWLQNLGADVKGLSLTPPTAPSLFEVARVADGMTHSITDIRDFAKVKNQMADFQPEIIFHLAAQPLVRLSYLQPIETYATNVMGTVHVLEAARLCGTVKAIVNVTTDKCYENREWIWGYRENEPMGGSDPYSSSKGCSELISAAYLRSFFQNDGIAIATARAGNVIGGGDWAQDRLIPDILRALERSIPVQIRNPDAIRPWQHVLDPIAGYLLLAERLFTSGQKFSEGWNFGPKDQDARPVRWIAERLFSVWGGGPAWEIQAGAHPHEANILRLDISKARSRLQWEPRWTLEIAVDRIVDWHKAWLSGVDMREKTVSQIREFSGMS